MIGIAMYTTIETLWKRHKNKSKIARLTGHDWKTVAKMIRAIEEDKEYPKKKPHPRVLDPYKEQIIKWMEEDLTGVRIHEELQEMGVKVGYSTVKDYLAKIKKKRKYIYKDSYSSRRRIAGRFWVCRINFGQLRQETKDMGI